MSENKKKRTSSVSNAKTLEEIGEFWNTHSLDDYWDETREAEFNVRAERKNVSRSNRKSTENSKPKRAYAAAFPKH